MTSAPHVIETGTKTEKVTPAARARASTTTGGTRVDVDRGGPTGGGGLVIVAANDMTAEKSWFQF